MTNVRVYHLPSYLCLLCQIPTISHPWNTTLLWLWLFSRNARRKPWQAWRMQACSSVRSARRISQPWTPCGESSTSTGQTPAGPVLPSSPPQTQPSHGRKWEQELCIKNLPLWLELMSDFDVKAEAECLALQGFCMCVTRPNLLSFAVWQRSCHCKGTSLWSSEKSFPTLMIPLMMTP